MIFNTNFLKLFNLSEIIKQAKEGKTNIGALTESVKAYKESTIIAASATQVLGTTLKSVFFSSAITLVIGALTTALFKVADAIIHYKENIREAAEEAMDTFNELNSNLSNKVSTTNNVKERYAELSQKVNQSTDGETSFRGAWKELKDNGYLIQYKLQDKETKQFYYEYEICDNPHVENQPVASITPYVENPLVGCPHVESLNGGIPIQWETTLYNNSLSNNNINNNTLYTNIIQTNIDYNPVFVGSLDQELVDNIVNVIVDVFVTRSEYIKINNREISSENLKSILLKVNMDHIGYTVNVIKSYTNKITNMKNFILSVLYNAVLTLDSHYQNMVGN